jgi:hypothetical protein
MNKNKHNNKALLAGLCALLAIASQPAQAVRVSAGDFSDNDCAGFFNGPDKEFGTGFSACEIFITTGENGETETIKLSPVIAKFNATLDRPPAEEDINTAKYPTVDGNEWTFSNTANSNGTGEFTYNPGTDDPGMKFWVAKSANDFNLFWDVDQSFIDDLTCVGGLNQTQTNYNLDCLLAANVVTSGAWETEPGGGGNPRELSHLTFYNTKAPCIPGTPGCGGGEEEVPEPSMLALLGIGLLSGLLARRRFTNQG